MSSEDELRQELLERVKIRRAGINAFTSDLESRGIRLTNLSIVCCAVTTALTAGPAFGGERFTEFTQHLLQISSDAYVWRTLCFVAMLLSIVAAIATNMYKSHNMADNLIKAQTCTVQLEGLETAIALKQSPVKDAVKLYQQYLTEVPFIPEKPLNVSPKGKLS